MFNIRRSDTTLDSSTIFQLTAVIILILLSAFFSSAETAMTTVNKIRVQSLASQGDKRAIILEKIISNSPKMLSTILIGNNIVNMSVSALMTTLTIQLFGNAYVGIATGILTLLILIFGEITPKNLLLTDYIFPDCPSHTSRIYYYKNNLRCVGSSSH